MRSDLKIRKTPTGSGATAVQVVRYEGSACHVIQHMGSAHDTDACTALERQARSFIQAHCKQPDLLFEEATPGALLDVGQARLLGVTHGYARDTLLGIAQCCGLGALPALYQDLALMRIVEPASKLRTIELLARYFGVMYAQRSVYRLLPKLLEHQAQIETAAVQTAVDALQESLHLVLYDVTTLYFESFESYELQKAGFSKDNKHQQPQIVIGLITTRQGFPVMHEVFEGNTFEGHTMLQIVQRLHQRVGYAVKPVVVADAAMLSQANMAQLQAQGYRFIVGARLANLPSALITQLHEVLGGKDQALQRFTYQSGPMQLGLVGHFCAKRFRKDQRELDKHVQRAQQLLQRNEPGRRAKFVKKAKDGDAYQFDEILKAKVQRLLGLKGYVTNIDPQEMGDAQIMAHYRELWHVEQAFRMSKSDLRSRPIYHRTQDAVKAHVLLCFMALMMGKFLEIKTGHSLRKIRDELWQVQQASVLNGSTGEIHTLNMQPDPANSILSHIQKLLKPH